MSANVVGNVMGRYHPHSNDAIYDALVRMSQEFASRYPTVAKEDLVARAPEVILELHAGWTPTREKREQLVADWAALPSLYCTWMSSRSKRFISTGFGSSSVRMI